MIWRLVSLALASLTLASCSHPVEVTFRTESKSYQGLIYISGNVNNPGLYPYSINDRLADLVNAAGGLKEGNDNSAVELSFDSQNFPQKIDINRAEAWLLEALPGIGGSSAQAIVAYRENHGPFHVIDDLLKVPDIGPATIARIAPYVTVGVN